MWGLVPFVTSNPTNRALTSFVRIERNRLLQLSSAFFPRKRFEVGDDCSSIRGSHVVDVHRRAEYFALRPGPIFQNPLHLLVRETRKTGNCGNVICPICDVLHRHDPNWRTLQPRLRLQIPVRIPGGMALRTFGHFFNQVLTALNFLALSGGTATPSRRCKAYE